MYLTDTSSVARLLESPPITFHIVNSHDWKQFASVKVLVFSIACRWRCLNWLVVIPCHLTSFLLLHSGSEGAWIDWLWFPVIWQVFCCSTVEVHQCKRFLCAPWRWHCTLTNCKLWSFGNSQSIYFVFFVTPCSNLSTVTQLLLVLYGLHGDTFGFSLLSSSHCVVASPTKMVRHYLSKLSHMPRNIFQCHTASMWHWNMSHKSIMHRCKSHALIGWGAAVGVASHSRRDVIMSWHNYHMVPCQ